MCHGGAILNGKQQPASAGERIEYAQVCHAKGPYAAEARLYEQAFAVDPNKAAAVSTDLWGFWMAAHLKRGNRYNAACAACLSAAGQGKDSAKLDDKQRTHWRRQAVGWLNADLALWAKQSESAKPQDRAIVQQTLSHWQKDADLAGMREAAALAKLPAEERAACHALWAEVAELLKKTAGKERGNQSRKHERRKHEKERE